MKSRLLIGLLSFTLIQATNADTLSASIGAGFWMEAPSGGINTDTDSASVDVNDNLFWDDENQGYYSFTLEHFVPLIPNVRIISTKIDHDGSGNTNFVFDGDSFGGTVDNSVTLQTLDLIAYYEILDNVVSVDFGLDIKKIDLDYDFNAIGVKANDAVSVTLPLLYAMVGATPWPGLTISGELSYLNISDNGVSDFVAKVSYVSDFNVGAEIGYRTMKYELDDISDTNVNFTFDGIFAGAFIKF